MLEVNKDHLALFQKEPHQRREIVESFLRSTQTKLICAVDLDSLEKEFVAMKQIATVNFLQNETARVLQCMEQMMSDHKKELEQKKRG